MPMRPHEKPPPSTLEAISAWERFFKVDMPRDLQTLLLESNGPIFFDDSSGQELQFLSASAAVEYYDAYNFPTYCPSSIPIAMDGCGNFIVYKDEKNGPCTIFGMASGNLGWEDSVKLCNTVSELFEMEDLVDDRIPNET